MTKEEAINQLQDAKDEYKEYLTDEALNMAIKALEQEPILDKIRAEINKIYEREDNSVDCLNALNELKQFIDKYKGESEE